MRVLCIRARKCRSLLRVARAFSRIPRYAICTHIKVGRKFRKIVTLVTGSRSSRPTLLVNEGFSFSQFYDRALSLHMREKRINVAGRVYSPPRPIRIMHNYCPPIRRIEYAILIDGQRCRLQRVYMNGDSGVRARSCIINAIIRCSV